MPCSLDVHLLDRSKSILFERQAMYMFDLTMVLNMPPTYLYCNASLVASKGVWLQFIQVDPEFPSWGGRPNNVFCSFFSVIDVFDRGPNEPAARSNWTPTQGVQLLLEGGPYQYF